VIRLCQFHQTVHITVVTEHMDGKHSLYRFPCRLRFYRVCQTDYFSQIYFDYLIKEMEGNVIFFYAFFEGMPVSASIFFYNDKYMHYHLSGTLSEYRKYAATNLIISEAAEWAASYGIQKFHLGGGVGIDDSLLSFKKHFNRNGLINFCIGRNIFDMNAFNELVKLRKKNDAQFDETKPFLIQYRG